MTAIRRLRPAAAVLLVLAPALAGCMTPKVRPVVSQAVLEARARAHAPSADACVQIPLAKVSPAAMDFPFEASALPDLTRHPLVAATAWLECHPAAPVVIKPDADNHGTEAEQDALARRRAEAVRTYLAEHGVSPSRIRVLPRGGAEPAGEHLTILAEGRRW